MKYKIILLIMLFPVFVLGQKGRLDTLVKNVMTELEETWALGINSNTTVDIGVYNRYKKLFHIDARVDDDFNFRYFPGKQTGAYKITTTTKDFDVYAHDAALQVTKLQVDKWDTIGRKVDGPGYIIIVGKRTVYAEKPARYVLQDIDSLAAAILINHPGIIFEKNSSKQAAEKAIIENLKENLGKNPDSLYKFNSVSTLRIVMAYTPDDTQNPVKIMRIENLGNTLTCINDGDGDGILDSQDRLPKLFGEFTVKGMPDTDLDGVTDIDLDGVTDLYDLCKETYGSPDNKGCPESYFITNNRLDGAVGVQYNNATINLPELNELGYQDAIDVLQSKKGSLKNPGPVLGIYAGGDFGYYVGKAKRIGFSLGFSYARFVADHELIDPIVYTYQSSDGADLYRRQITISSLKEQIGYSVINIPVQLNYRVKIFNGKWVINFKGGPSLMLFYVTSNYNATIDVGGIYQVDTVNFDRIAYYDYFNPQSTWNVYLTSSGINNQNTNPGAAAVFAQINSTGNYDFASNKNYRDQKKLSRTTIAYNFSLDGVYKKKKDSRVSIRFGFHGVYAPSIGSKQRYVPIERTADEYSSIFNSNARSTYFAYGINLGLRYNF